MLWDGLSRRICRTSNIEQKTRNVEGKNGRQRDGGPKGLPLRRGRQTSAAKPGNFAQKRHSDL